MEMRNADLALDKAIESGDPQLGKYIAIFAVYRMGEYSLHFVHMKVHHLKKPSPSSSTFTVTQPILVPNPYCALGCIMMEALQGGRHWR